MQNVRYIWLKFPTPGQERAAGPTTDGSVDASASMRQPRASGTSARSRTHGRTSDYIREAANGVANRLPLRACSRSGRSASPPVPCSGAFVLDPDFLEAGNDHQAERALQSLAEPVVRIAEAGDRPVPRATASTRSTSSRAHGKGGSTTNSIRELTLASPAPTTPPSAAGSASTRSMRQCDGCAIAGRPGSTRLRICPPR